MKIARNKHGNVSDVLEGTFAAVTKWKKEHLFLFMPEEIRGNQKLKKNKTYR